MIQLVSPQKIKTVLQQSRRIAVVGLSPKPARPSHRVAAYLLRAGYDVIPVNPGHEIILDRRCYPNLSAVPGTVDIVDIFRRAEHVMPVVLEAVEKKVSVIWMQQGIVNHEAAALAEKQGIIVIMDRCIQIDHQQYMN